MGIADRQVTSNCCAIDIKYVPLRLVRYLHSHPPGQETFTSLPRYSLRYSVYSCLIMSKSFILHSHPRDNLPIALRDRDALTRLLSWRTVRALIIMESWMDLSHGVP